MRTHGDGLDGPRLGGDALRRDDLSLEVSTAARRANSNLARLGLDDGYVARRVRHAVVAVVAPVRERRVGVLHRLWPDDGRLNRNNDFTGGDDHWKIRE